jgi:hypothetical protein
MPDMRKKKAVSKNLTLGLFNRDGMKDIPVLLPAPLP